LPDIADTEFISALWAKTPHSIAFLPSELSANASPIHAPRAICVMESIRRLNDYRIIFFELKSSISSESGITNFYNLR
jgi:hypothetical protein